MRPRKQLSKANQARRTVEYWGEFCTKNEYILTDLTEDDRGALLVTQFQDVWDDIRNIPEDQAAWNCTMRQSPEFNKAVDILSSCVSVNRQAKLDGFEMHEADYRFLSLLASKINDERCNSYYAHLKMMDLYDHRKFKSLFEDRKKSKTKKDKMHVNAGFGILDVLSALEFNTWMLIVLMGICIQISILTWYPAVMMFDSLFGSEGMRVAPYAGLAGEYVENQGLHTLNSKPKKYYVHVVIVYATLFGNTFHISDDMFLMDTSSSDWTISKDGQTIRVTFDDTPKNIKSIEEVAGKTIRTKSDCGVELTSYFWLGVFNEITTFKCYIYDPVLDNRNEKTSKTEPLKSIRDATCIDNHIGPRFSKFLIDQLLEFYIWLEFIAKSGDRKVYRKYDLINTRKKELMDAWMHICPFQYMWMADYELFQYTYASIRARNPFISFIPSILTVFSSYYIWFKDGDNKFFASIGPDCVEIRDYLSQFSMKVLVLGAPSVMRENNMNREYSKGIICYHSVGMCWQFRWFVMVVLKLLISVWCWLGLFFYTFYTLFLTLDCTVGSNSDNWANVTATFCFGLSANIGMLKCQYSVAKWAFKKIEKLFWQAWKLRNARKRGNSTPGLFKTFVDAIYAHEPHKKCFTLIVVTSVFCEYLISSRAYFVLFHESVYAWAGVTCLLAWYTYKNSKAIDRAKCSAIACLYMLTPIMSCLPGFNPPGIENGGTNAWSIGISYYLFHFGFLTCNGWIALCLKAMYLFYMQSKLVQHR